jgi:hypothetical protein
MTILGWILAGILFLAIAWWLLDRWAEKSLLDDEFDGKVEPLTLAPFGTLRWTKHGWWEGQAQSPAWAGFGSEIGGDGISSDGSFTVCVPHAAKGDRIPTEAQKMAYEFQMDHAGEVANLILNALPKYYADLRQDWMLTADAMPDITDAEKFRSLIGLDSITVHPFRKDGLAYVGLLFACEWDSEHQFGVMLHGLQIVGMGDHDAASEDAMPVEAQHDA